MKKMIIELSDSNKIVIEKEYVWIDDVFKQINDKENFILIDNNIISKKEIKKIEVMEEGNKDE